MPAANSSRPTKVNRPDCQQACVAGVCDAVVTIIYANFQRVLPNDIGEVIHQLDLTHPAPLREGGV